MSTLPRYTKQYQHLPAAYTLIEILVALTIIGILFTFGYVSFRDFSRRQALVGVVKQVQGDLRLAQQMALSGQKPIACGASNALNGYTFTAASGGYTITASCVGATPGSVKDVVLPYNVTLSSSVNPILFKVLGQGTNIPNNGSDAVLTLTQLETGKQATVKVTASGEIKQ